jgi:nitroimidazol reductase NimA-like FMN-containing flavoprotein (pyridoxamine 5'-phosphate oxidase superfamily)
VPAVKRDLPPEVVAVFDNFRTCELTTVAKDGTPTTWPAMPFYRPEQGTFLFSTSVGLPQKAYNVRRNPKVCLLFSDATGSGLVSPPTVLVQGDAECPDELAMEFEGMEEFARRAYERQPFSRHYGMDPISRRLFGWYYLRLLIHVTPHRVVWWPDGDLTRAPEEVAAHVA